MEEGVIMVLDGKSKIMIEDLVNAEATVFAKENLEKYIANVLGVKFVKTYKSADFIVKLSLSDNEKIKYDGFNVFIKDNICTISALCPRGVLYGAYDFLEKFFGVKFFAPDCEIVERKESVKIKNCDYTDNPDFPLRGAYNAGTRFDKEYYSKLRNHHQFESTPDKFGGDVGWARIEGQTGHNTLCYISPEKYFKSHPELFAVRNGNVTDICLTNGVKEDGSRDKKDIDCVGLIADYIIDYINKDSSVLYFMIGQQDSWGGNERECECPSCKKARETYKSSGVLIRFINLISDEVTKYLKENNIEREIIFVGFAYSQTYLAPVKEEDGKLKPIDSTVIPRDNVHIWYCTTNDTNNMLYPFFDKKHNPLDAKNFEGWTKLTKNLMLWDYGVNFSEYNWFIPATKFICEDIRKMKTVNCEYAMALFGYTDIAEWQSSYKGYVASKILWNTKLDEKKVLKEYLSAYYKVGAKYVEQMISLFEAHFEKLGKTRKEFIVKITKSDDILFNAEYYPLSLLDKAEELLNQAEKRILNLKTPDKEILLKRIHAVMLTPLSMKFYNYFYYYKDRKGIYEVIDKIKKYSAENNMKVVSEGKNLNSIEWLEKTLKEFDANPILVWDLYRYIYDGYVGNYQLPSRKK